MTKSTKRFSYKGIPAKERARVAKLLRLQGDGIDFLDIKPQTPQEAWAGLQKHWAKQRAEEQAKKNKLVKERAGNIRRHAIDDLRTALRHLLDAHEAAGTIEEETEAPFDSTMTGKFVRLILQEAGEKMEQSLCNLGLIEESDTGYFVNTLKREGVEVPSEKAVAHDART